MSFRDTVNNHGQTSGKYFKVTADIDLSSICNATSDESWEPISNNSPYFAGHFDGGGKIIANLFIDSSEMEQGLFGKTESGSSVENVSLINATVSGGYYTGSLIGYADGSVANCYAVSNVSGESGVGGLIGVADGSSVSCCYAVSNVTGNESVGGLIGMKQGSSVSCCYAAGTVSGNDNIGGLIGEVNDCSVEYCAALNSEVKGDTVGKVAGFVESDRFFNNYAWENMRVSRSSSGVDGESVSSADIWANISFYRDVLDWTIGDTSLWQIVGFDDGVSYPLPYLWTMPDRAAAADLKPEPVLSEVTLEASDSTPNTQTVSIWTENVTFAETVTVPVRTGYVFDGYFAENNLTGTRVFDADGKPVIADGYITEGGAWNNTSDTLALHVGWTAAWQGSGTESDPYQIKTAGNLANLSIFVNNGNSYSGTYFRLMNNIDLSGYESWTPIGSGAPITGSRIAFEGSFNGSGYAITGLTINDPDNDYAGLFGYISNAEIRNINLTVKNVTGGENVGGLVGSASAGGSSISIENCYATGDVNGSSAGGLVGSAYAVGSSIRIENCYATGDVTGSDSAGGLVRSASALDSGSVTIENCAALNPSVSGSGSVGRIAGIIEGTVNINNAYALSTMSSGSATDGTDVSPGDAASQSFYKDTLKWDFGEIWNMNADISRYPYLRMNIPNAQPVKIISYVGGAIGAVIISENPVPDDFSLIVSEVSDKDVLPPPPAEATPLFICDITVQNAPSGGYQCIIKVLFSKEEIEIYNGKIFQTIHITEGQSELCYTETIKNPDGSSAVYFITKGFSPYMIVAVTPAVPVEYSGGGSTDTGSGHYTEYPRTVTDGGFVSFGTSPTVSSVDLPKGVSGSVILVVESKTPAPDGKPTYTVFEINIPNYPKGEEAVIQFRITLEELKKAGYDAEDICLYHCDENGVWTALPTTFTIKDGVVYYESITTEFSPFAIVYEENGAAEVSQPAVTAVMPTAEPVQTYVEPTKTAVPTPEQTKSPVGFVGIGLGLLGAAVVLRRK